ncbi:MAG: polyphosphate kinase 1 [Chloroflexi bacterium]|nr:polyphosphate kinase 1 [Chloroflexota bacterium]
MSAHKYHSREEGVMPNDLPELTPDNFTNRELSWIEFNRRVLAQAEDTRWPPLERLKFLAIVSSNFDEFFMVRVAMVHQRAKFGLPPTRPDGLPYAALLDEIRALVLPMMRQQRQLMHELLDQLKEAGVAIRAVGELEPTWRACLRRYFNDEVFPVLTPLAVDHARPFPFISNLSLNLAVKLKRKQNGNGEQHFVRLKIPEMVPRLIPLDMVLSKYCTDDTVIDGYHNTFVWVEDLLAANLDLLFPGMEILEHSMFRVTRNADIDFESELEDPETDMSEIIEEGLRVRRFGSAVRLTVPDDITPGTLQRLIRQLEIDSDRDVYRVNGALGLSSLTDLLSVDQPELKDPPYLGRLPIPSDADIFSEIRKHDFLVHHPYDSFNVVEQFFRAAAFDPDVLMIKTTLYRVGRNSPIVQALIDARDSDKQVTALVELKARFDEENNLVWARALDRKGVHVIYGVEDLAVKTHAKVTLVVRREPDGLRRYVHLGTGNYNASTARIYTDIGMFSCHPALGDDASRLFNRLTGYAPGTTYNRLLVAPEYLLPKLLERVDGEIEAARAGKPARIIAKMNQLEEDTIIRKLYAASQAGVQIDLLVRGICCLRPGIPGVSENIRVTSIVGRFLEHSRIYYFQNAAAEERVYLGSADLMRRNLLNRVEVVYPVLDQHLQRQILRILATQLRDNCNSWLLQPDDTYQRVEPGDAPVIDSHALFMRDSHGLDELP